MGDVTDPGSWQDALGSSPPADYQDGLYQYTSQFPNVGDDPTVPFQYTGLFRANLMSIPWQYVPGTLDMGASINVSLNGGASWINTQIAPPGGGQTLTGTIYVNLTGARLILVNITRGPSMGLLAATASFAFTLSGNIQTSSVEGEGDVTFDASATLTALGALAGSPAITMGASATWSATVTDNGTGTVTFGASATAEALTSISGSAGITFAASGTLTSIANQFYITAGGQGGSPIYWGYVPSICGSVYSQSVSFGTVAAAYTSRASGIDTTVLEINAGSDPTQSAFTTMALHINPSPFTFASSAATYGYSGGVATWSWPVAANGSNWSSSVPGSVYEVVLL